MSVPHIQIRLLETADASPYRAIRLEALQRDAEAFGSTFEVESMRPLSWFAERLSTSSVFGAFRGQDLVGTAGLFLKTGQKEAHKGFLWGMYVQPNLRNAGVGRRLVEAVIDFARSRVELVQLAVVCENEQARRLYAGVGFLEYGLERNALKQDGRYYDEILMAKDLRVI